MHRINAKQLLAVALLLGCASPLSASIQVGDHIKLGNGVGSPGGIFLVDDLNDPGTLNFYTFCVEITEFVNFTSTYAVQNIGYVTQMGGKTLTSYTAWLYSSFLDGALNSFNASSMSDANALQLALWKSIGYSQTDINTYIGASWYNTYNAVLSGKSWATDFASDGDWVGTGDIQVMNLRKLASDGVTYTDYAQDQLVRIPLESPQIPEATSLMIWGLLASCCAFASGRRRSSTVAS